MVFRKSYSRELASSPREPCEPIQPVAVPEIAEMHRDSRGTYGSPRVYRELKRRGTAASRHRVARLMRKDGLQAKTKRRFKATTDSRHFIPRGAGVISIRDFTPEGPNRVWASDITYIWTTEGWFYLAVVMDLYSRRHYWLVHG